MADGQTGPAIKYGFEQLGHAVKAVDAKLHSHDSYRAACEFKPDLIFCSRTQALTWKVAEIKAKLKNVVACVWNVDTRANISHWKHLFPLIEACDYYFVPDTKTISQWRKINSNTFWLPQGLQDEVYNKPREIMDNDRKKYSCDISFAGGLGGSSHVHRGKYLDMIKQMDVKLKLWGCDGNPKVYNKEHNKMVLLSKINFCCSAFPENEQYTSVRNYKILGAGGFALEFYREGIYEIFPKNVIKCYTSPENLKEKIRYWLNHDQERQQIADMAYKWVHENATYTHRIKDALKYMGMV